MKPTVYFGIRKDCCNYQSGSVHWTVADTFITDFSFENCSFCISILYDISSLIRSSVVNRKFLSSALSPEMTCMWLGYSQLFPNITVIFLFFFRQELSGLVIGYLPLDADKAGLRNILSKVDATRGERGLCSIHWEKKSLFQYFWVCTCLALWFSARWSLVKQTKQFSDCNRSGWCQ